MIDHRADRLAGTAGRSGKLYMVIFIYIPGTIYEHRNGQKSARRGRSLKGAKPRQSMQHFANRVDARLV